MKKRNEHTPNDDHVLPGDKIAIIEEFLPDETCFEQNGSIYSKVLGQVVIDPKKHKISVVPEKQFLEIKNGEVGFARVEFVKKQMASVNIHKIEKKSITIPTNAILHISEVSRRFVKNMYEVTRPGDWIKFRVIRANKVIYISLIGEGLGVVESDCIVCGHELKFKRRNLLECPNCSQIQPRITSKHFGRPIKP